METRCHIFCQNIHFSIMTRSHAVTLAHSTGTFHTHQRIPLRVCFFLSETLPNSFAEFKNVTRASSWVRSNRSKVQFCVTNPFERDFVLSLVFCFLFVLFTPGREELGECVTLMLGVKRFFSPCGQDRGSFGGRRLLSPDHI